MRLSKRNLKYLNMMKSVVINSLIFIILSCTNNIKSCEKLQSDSQKIVVKKIDSIQMPNIDIIKLSKLYSDDSLEYLISVISNKNVHPCNLSYKWRLW